MEEELDDIVEVANVDELGVVLRLLLVVLLDMILEVLIEVLLEITMETLIEVLLEIPLTIDEEVVGTEVEDGVNVTGTSVVVEVDDITVVNIIVDVAGVY